MEILNILKGLDPANDEQWTSEGLPQVSAVQKLLGADVSRQQINEAWPNFNRKVAEMQPILKPLAISESVDSAPDLVEENNSSVVEAPAPSKKKVTKAVDFPKVETAEPDTENIEAQIKALEKQIAQVVSEIKEKQEEQTALQKERDALIEKSRPLSQPSSAAISSYLAAQAARTNDKSDVIEQLIKAGVSSKVAIKVAAAPVDRK